MLERQVIHEYILIAYIQMLKSLWPSPSIPFHTPEITILMFWVLTLTDVSVQTER